MNLIVNNDYPFLLSNHPHLLEWLKEYGGFMPSPGTFIVNCETIDDHDAWMNFQCAITQGIVNQLIREGK